MKTAMQQLFEWLENSSDIENDILDWETVKENALKKEKESMLHFGLYVKKNGWVGCKIEDLYEDYNNQNK